VDRFYYCASLTKDGAELDADPRRRKAARRHPEAAVFNKDQLDKYNAWIASYVNVPLEQMTSFTTGSSRRRWSAEPAAHTQELYTALDPSQAVLTNKNADIDKLLDRRTDVQSSSTELSLCCTTSGEPSPILCRRAGRHGRVCTRSRSVAATSKRRPRREPGAGARPPPGSGCGLFDAGVPAAMLVVFVCSRGTHPCAPWS